MATWVVPRGDGFAVACSCGYLVTGWPNQALAQADLENHWSRCHESRKGDDGNA